MKMKMVQVSEETHKRLKVGAANANVSLKDFVEKLSIKNISGTPFDVSKFSVADKLEVFEDITLNMYKEEMTKEQELDYVRIIENIPFHY